MSLMKKKESKTNVTPINEKATEQMTAIKLSLIDNALTFLSKYDPLVQAAHVHGPENLMQCLALLTPSQIMTITRGVMKSVTREVYNEFAIVYREQEAAVRNGGVDSMEVSFSEFISDYAAREFENDMPIAALKEQALHEIYQTLQTAFLIAEKAQFGSRPDYDLQGLPFYYYQTGGDSGIWVNVMTAEEAFTTIEKEREMFKAAQQEERNSKIAELKNLKFA